MKFKDNLLTHMIDSYIADLENYYEREEATTMIYWLVEDFFGATRTRIAMTPDWRLSESEMLKLHFANKELKRYKPVQYIVGKVPFMNLTLQVTPDVLIPRPETEQLVDWMMKMERKKDLSVLDAGTGSGCIALALKQGWPESKVCAYDKSEKAIEVAKSNAEFNSLEVSFFVADMNQALVSSQSSFDVIVSNPPYVLQSEQSLMQPNVLDYEPHSALFVSDENPLHFYRAILNQSSSGLLKGGRIYFEINEQLGNEMVVLLENMNFVDIQLQNDLNRKPRFIRAVKA